MKVCEVTLGSSVEKRWEAVAKLVRAYEGQVRVVQPEKARWILTDICPGQISTSSSLGTQKQLQVPPATIGQKLGHGGVWLSPAADSDIERQVFDVVTQARSDLNRPDVSVWPKWSEQVVTLVVPCETASGKEWHLHANVATMGQLLSTLGDRFTAAQIEAYWLSLIVVVEKKVMEKPRGTKRKRS